MGVISNEVTLSDDIFRDYMANFRGFSILSEEETIRLVGLAKKGDEEALDLLIKSNIRLIVYVAKKHINQVKNMEMVDLIQEGVIGFIKAIIRYDDNLGKLSTYAVYWIEQSIMRAISTQEDTIRKSSEFIINRNRYLSLMDSINKGIVQPLTNEEICNHLNISLDMLNLIKMANTLSPLSIDQPLEDSKDEIKDLLGTMCSKYNDVESGIDNNILLAFLKELLSPVQYYIIYHHILYPDKSLESIGEELYISTERIRNIETKALNLISRNYDSDSKNLLIDFKKYNNGIQYAKSNTMPIEPLNVIKYMYVAKELTEQERRLLYLKLFNNAVQSHKSIAENLACSESELDSIESDLRRKLLNKFKDTKRFKKYVIGMSRLYKTSIFDLVKHDLQLVTSNEIPFISSYEIEKEIYFTAFNYKEDCVLPTSKLIEAFKSHRDSFTEEQTLFLECYIFKFKNIKQFLKKYPNSSLPTNHEFLINKLEIFYYGINQMFSINISKKEYLAIKEKFSNILSSRRILLLDLYFGTESKPLTVMEIARFLCEPYNNIHSEIYSAIQYVQNLYYNNSRDLVINCQIYLPYLLNKQYVFTKETKMVLLMYLKDGLSKDEIVHHLNIDRTRVNNIIDDGLRKIDYYRFEIIKPDYVSEDTLADFFANSSNNFDEISKKIIIAKKNGLKNNEELIKEYGVSKRKIDSIMERFNILYNAYAVRDIELKDEDILSEIIKEDIESVIDPEDKIILSLWFGFNTKYNKEGVKITQNAIANYLGCSVDVIRDKIRKSLINIKQRMSGFLKPELEYIEKEDLEVLMHDKHLPIPDDRKEIICYLFGFFGYPIKSIDEISQMHNTDVNSIKRAYQRAIVSICKYKNHEIDGILDYETDIVPNLKYFSKRDKLFIVESYQNKLTNHEIAIKYELSLHYINKHLMKLKNILNAMQHGNYFSIDFEFYRKVIDSEYLPYFGNIELVKKVFELYTGESTLENLSFGDIKALLNLNCSEETIRRHISMLILAVLKYKNGIKKQSCFSYEEIFEYYESNKDNMSAFNKNQYLRYFDSMHSRSEFTDSNSLLNDVIIFDLLKEQYPDLFNIDSVSVNEISQILNRYDGKLNSSVNETLKMILNQENNNLAIRALKPNNN